MKASESMTPLATEPTSAEPVPLARKLSTSSIGEKLGEGSQKIVFHSKKDDQICFSLFKSGTFGSGTSLDAALKEQNGLNTLQRAGFPVVRTIGLVEHEGAHGLEQEIIKDAIDSADVLAKKVALPAALEFNQHLVDGCVSVVKNLRDKQLRVDDLQFLIDGQGEPKISDPREVTRGDPQANINMVNALKGMAFEKVLEHEPDRDSD
ncbi:hypothetical protein [Rugamonas sp. DEMB1]|uniref:hypothetical protein n=1 Tax=Rugamonas sp. DEMB1 TaxID=3039386 RepID=UPI00244722CC|nr:hypothetical protein [Rugamonas sp. DEMB1]WGG53173.1 hypothetical protein QC826_14305 [Rugamonas sp. DEMB1]